MTHIMIPENIAVTTENGFTAPISAWEQNIAVDSHSPVSCSPKIPDSHLRTKTWCLEGFRGPKSLQFQV